MQAIKKVLNENFHEEEAHPQSLLYKNLWLEAEAALSSITYKARFNRIKAEMERCQSQPSNGKNNTKIANREPSHSWWLKFSFSRKIFS